MKFRPTTTTTVRKVPRPDRNLPTVLAVDDEPAILRMLAHALGQRGFDVRTALGGEAGVAAYRRQHGIIAFVLLDVQMPLPWDGPHTLVELGRINPLVRVAFMSGSTGRYSVEELLGLGALRIFEKPFPSVPGLADELKNLIARTAAEEPDTQLRRGVDERE